MAAGVTMDPANMEAFRTRLNEAARRTLDGASLLPLLRIDAEIELGEISLESLVGLDKLRPFGQENPAPQFFARGLTHHRPVQRMGKDKQHVKLWATDGTTVHEAVWWSAGSESLPEDRFDLAFAPQLNAYNGRTVPQLKVLDWRPSGDAQGQVESKP